MSNISSTTWARKWLPILILVLIFLAIPFQSAVAATALQQDIHVANDQAQLWFAVIAMSSLVLLGIIWVLWPERRRHNAKVSS